MQTSGNIGLNSVAKNPVQRSLCSLSNASMWITELCKYLHTHADNDTVEHSTNEMPSAVKNNTWNGGTTSGYFNMSQGMNIVMGMGISVITNYSVF